MQTFGKNTYNHTHESTSREGEVEICHYIYSIIQYSGSLRQVQMLEHASAELKTKIS